MVGHYGDFFVASAGASAAILGLLVVAVTVVNADDANVTTRELRTVPLYKSPALGRRRQLPAGGRFRRPKASFRILPSRYS